MSSPERIIPDETEAGIIALHLKRYEFARTYCEGKDVLDAGCGVGYGSAFLADTARRVVAVDLSEQAIAYARRRYQRANVEFAVADVTHLPHADGAFDVVCAFETVEHLAQPERFVAEARRVLRPTAVLIVSTPRAAGRARSDNPFHEREYSAAELEQLLRTGFGEIRLYGQRRVETARHAVLRRLDVLGLRKRVAPLRRVSRAVTGTAAMDEVTTDEIMISPERLDDATELIAVCRP